MKQKHPHNRYFLGRLALFFCLLLALACSPPPPPQEVDILAALSDPRESDC